MKIKKREVLFSVIIAAALLIVGIMISNSIAEGQQARVEKFTTAIQIDTPDQFTYGLNTSFGNALVYGEITANHPVTFPELSDEYMAVCKVQERYTMHTRTYTTTDPQGCTQVHTETYWTWDYVGQTDKISDTVQLLGVDFPISKLNLPAYGWLTLKDGSSYQYDSMHVRYYYMGIPSSFTATIHTDLLNGDIGESVPVFLDEKPDELVSRQLESQNTPVVVFWGVWLILSFVGIMYFVRSENKWID